MALPFKHKQFLMCASIQITASITRALTTVCISDFLVSIFIYIDIFLPHTDVRSRKAVMRSRFTSLLIIIITGVLQKVIL